MICSELYDFEFSCVKRKTKTYQKGNSHTDCEFIVIGGDQ